MLFSSPLRLRAQTTTYLCLAKLNGRSKTQISHCAVKCADSCPEIHVFYWYQPFSQRCCFMSTGNQMPCVVHFVKQHIYMLSISNNCISRWLLFPPLLSDFMQYNFFSECEDISGANKTMTELPQALHIKFLRYILGVTYSRRRSSWIILLLDN